MSELKPCPFCDGRTTVKTRYIGYGSLGLGSHDEYRVVCQECHASSDEYRHEAEAIAVWNRRADAVPVVRGEWIEPDENDITTACICSLCDWRGHIMEDDVMGMPYCPNCGAKMEDKPCG